MIWPILIIKDVFLSNDLANRWTDRALLNRLASHRSWEGLCLFWGRVTSSYQEKLPPEKNLNSTFKKISFFLFRSKMKNLVNAKPRGPYYSGNRPTSPVVVLSFFFLGGEIPSSQITKYLSIHQRMRLWIPFTHFNI